MENKEPIMEVTAAGQMVVTVLKVTHLAQVAVVLLVSLLDLGRLAHLS